ncbi:TonB-dependent receptor [Saprospiraceae bacterium]|nr:TonB-dependent receptor [Saprospiraceae bacterium]
MKLFLIIISLLVASQLLSQNSGITGTVKDAETNEPLLGATVRINEKGTVTAIDGTFKIAYNPGEYDMTIDYIGYTTSKYKVIISDNSFNQVDALMMPSTTLLQTATVTGSKHQKSIARSPVSIEVIKPDLIRNTNAVRLTSVLDKLPGVQLIDNQANIRGGSGWSFGAGSRVLLLIDDIPALQGDAGRPLWSDVPIENISQVEVLKGAASTLYGSSALNGIINIRTGYATTEPTTRASLSYVHYMSPQDENKKWWDTLPSPSRINASLLHKQKFGNLDIVANAFYENFDSYYQDSYENRYRLSLNAKYKVNDRISIGLNSLYNKGDSASPFLWSNGASGAYIALAGSLISTLSTRYYIDPQITIFDKNDNRHKIFGRYYSITNGNTNNQSNASTSTYAEYQFLKKIDDWDMDITTGTAAYFVSSNSELFGDVNLSSNNIAGYAEVDKRFGDRLTTTFGLRYEYNFQESPENFRGDTIPGGTVTEAKLIARMGMNYKLDTATFLRASWGQGYRFPTITERFIETSLSGFFIFPNVFLESESGWTSEVGAKQGIKIGSWEGFVDVAFFWSQYNNMTEFTFVSIDGRQGFQSQNVGETDIKGYEVNLAGRSRLFGIPLNIIAGYTYINPIYRDFDSNEAIRNSISIPVGEDDLQNILKYRTRHNFKVDAEGTFNNLTAGMAIIYSSATETIDELLNNIGLIGFYRNANPGGFVKLDSRVSYSLGQLKISLLVENILNQEYTLRPGLLESPRNIGMRLDYKI